MGDPILSDQTWGDFFTQKSGNSSDDCRPLREMPHEKSSNLDRCFDWKGPSFGRLKHQNRGERGSRNVMGVDQFSDSFPVRMGHEPRDP